MFKRLIGTATTSAVSALLTRGAQFITAIFYARYLTTADFGIFGIIQAPALLFTTFYALNLGQMATKLTANARTAGGKELEVAVVLSYKSGAIFSVPLFLALCVVSVPISDIATGTGSNWKLFAWAAFLIPIGTVIAIQNGIALGLEITKSQAKTNLITTPIIMAAGYLAALERNLQIALYAYIAGQILVAIAQQVAINRALKEKSLKPMSCIAEHLDWTPVKKYGLPSSIAGLLTMPSNWIAMVILANSTNGVHELGLFMYANQYKAIAYFAIGVLANAAIPQLTKLYTSKNYSAYKKILVITTISLASLLTMLVIVTAGLGELLIQSITPHYAAAHIPLVILVASCIPTALTSLLMRSGTARGSAKEMLLANLVFAIILIASALLLQSHGAIGIAFAFLIGSALQAGVLMYQETASLRAWKNSSTI